MATVTSLGFSIFTKYKGGGVKTAQKDLDTFSSKMQSAGGSIASVGAGMTAAVTGPIAGAGAAVLKMGGDFEQSMQRVKAVSGATEEEFASLRDMAKDLGSTTQFSASEAAEGMSFLAMAGFDAADTLDALPGVLDLAAAGAVDLGTAADVASNILSGYGMQAAEVGRLNDILAKTFTSTNTTLEMLGESMKYVAPVAASAGLSIEETSAAIGLLGNAGIQGSEAGTALRGAIGNLLSPTAQVQELLDGLGVSALDSSGELRSLTDIVGQLEDAGASTADMLGIFGLEAGPAMQALLSQGSGALKTLTGELKEAGGTAEEIATTQMEGFNGGVKELQSAVEGMAIAIAESGLLAWATELTSRVTGWVQALSKSNPMLLKVSVIIALILAVIGPLVVMIGVLVMSIGAIGAVLTPVIGVVAAVVAGIVALGVAVWAAYKRSDAFRAGVVATWEGIKTGWNALWGGALKPGLDALLAWWESTWPSIKDTALQAWGAIVSYFQGIWPKIKEIFGQVSAIVLAFVGELQGVWAQHGGWITGVVRGIWDFVVGIFKGATTLLVTIIKAAWQIISGVFSGALSVISGILDVFIGLFTGDWSRMWEGVKKIFSGLWTAVVGIFKGAVTLIKGVLKALYQAIVQPIVNIYNRIVGNSIIPDLVNGVVAWFKRLWNMSKAIFSTLVSWVIAKVVGFYRKVISTVASLVSGFVSRIASLRDRARAIWNALVSWHIARAGVLRDRVVSAVTTLKDKLISAFTRAKDGIKKAWDKLEKVAKDPVKFVIKTVYNDGVVGLWNKVAKKVPGLSELKTMKMPKGFHRGGILPGHSSWRGGDTHLRPMREGEGVYVSEAMRDPYERARLHAVNRAAMSGRSLEQFRDVPLARSASDVARGQPPLDDMQGFARGGIVGAWLSDKWDDVVGKAKEWATKPLNALRDRLKEKFGSGNDFAGIPYGMLKAWREKILDRFGKADSDHAAAMVGGADNWVGLESASARLRRAATWARQQHGKPYIWGGAGPRGYDCSGFTGAIENKIRGVGPHFRRYSTHAFRGSSAPSGWVRGLKSPYMVGITHAGVGHTSGTLMGVNVEAAGGGKGVRVGRGARGARHPLYSSVYGFAPVAGDRTAGTASSGGGGGVAVFDNGGTLAPGLNLVDNRTGSPEELRRADYLDQGPRELHLHFHGPVASKKQAEDMVVEGYHEAVRKGRIPKVEKVRK